jgi:O-Antigen ligase
VKGRLQAALGREPLLSGPVTLLLTMLLAAVLAMVLQRLGNPQHQLKGALGGVAIGVIVAAALRPVFALGLVVALMPFEYHVYGLGTNEVLVFSTAAILAWRIHARRVPWWMMLASSALVIGSFLTIVNAHDRGSALWGAARWLGVLILLAAAFSVLHDRADATRRLMDIIICSAVVVVGFAWLQRAGIYVIVGPPYQAGQISSTFGYYTVYGGFVGMAAVLATGEILHSLASGQRRRGVAYSAALLVILLGVAVSLARGALLCLGAGWMVLLILNVRRASLLARGVALVAVFIVAGYLATPPATRTHLINRFSTPIGSQTEDRQRFALQKAGRTALSQNPAGLGYGNFSFYLDQHPASGANIRFFHSHQLVTQIGLDAGWIGLAGFLALLAGALVVAFRAAPRGGVRNTAFAAALCGLMAQGLFDYLFYEISMVALWAALLFGAAHTPARGIPDASLG